MYAAVCTLHTRDSVRERVGKRSCAVRATKPQVGTVLNLPGSSHTQGSATPSHRDHEVGPLFANFRCRCGCGCCLFLAGGGSLPGCSQPSFAHHSFAWLPGDVSLAPPQPPASATQAPSRDASKTGSTPTYVRFTEVELTLGYSYMYSWYDAQRPLALLSCSRQGDSRENGSWLHSARDCCVEP